MKYIKLIIINLFVFILMMLFLESASFAGRLVLGKDNLGWLIKYNFYESAQDPANPCNKMKTHPIYSHVSDHGGECEIRGGLAKEQFVFYQENSNNPAILILGGSTSSGFYQNYANGYTYPFLLNEKVKSHNYQIINGGLGGYSSTQELQKLVVDGRRLNANISLIISFNGVNDIPGYHGNEKKMSNYHPFMTEEQFKMLNDQVWIIQDYTAYSFFPSFKSLLGLVAINKNGNKNFNIDNTYFKTIKAADRWHQNIKIMRKVSEAMGADYIAIIQPTMGLNGLQNKIATNKNNDSDLLRKVRSYQTYIKELNEFYDEIRAHCLKLDYCYDFSNVAPPTGNNYTDYRHHNENGNEIIAENIFHIIKSRVKITD